MTAGRQEDRVSATDATSDLEDLRRRLIEQADLFEGSDYEAGVLDTLDAVIMLLEDGDGQGGG